VAISQKRASASMLPEEPESVIGEISDIPESRFRLQTRRDHAEIERIKASSPCYPKVARFLKRVSDMLQASGEYLRVPEKAASLALVHFIARRINGRDHVPRTFTRTKEAAICWFCCFCPQVTTIDVALAANCAKNGLDKYRKRAGGVVPPRRGPRLPAETPPEPIQAEPDVMDTPDEEWLYSWTDQHSDDWQ
jgi:hypothetical protein